MMNAQNIKEEIQRPKKPRTAAQIAATKKMLEGRKQWAVNKGKENKAKKVAKLQEKIAKIDPEYDKEVEPTSSPQSENIEEYIEEGLSSEPIFKEDVDSGGENDLEDSALPIVSADDEKVSKSKPKGLARQNAVPAKKAKTKKKVKQVVNNYHYTQDESSSEEEEVITNNYYVPKKSKKKSKKKVVEPQYSESESEEEEYFQEEYYPTQNKTIRFV